MSIITNEHRRERQRHRQCHHDADAEAQRDEGHENHHAERGEELHHELVDGVFDDLRLVGDLGEGDADGRLVVDRHLFCVERLAELEAVVARLHHEAEHQRGLTVVADLEGAGVLVAALHLGDVAELEAAVAGGHGQVADRVEPVDGPVETQVDARTLGLDETCGRHVVLVGERGQDLLAVDPEGGEALVGDLDEDLLSLLAEDIDLLDARHP
ncbi:hypothetical protein M2437_002849 [Methylorubrum pseudosasae]|nr:hypothetical protein [Methylorubrum pseudosasae]